MKVSRRCAVRFLFALVMASVSLPAWATCEGNGLSKPGVSFDYAGPDLQGHGILSITYSFPNTASYLDRLIEVTVDGVPRYTERPTDAEGDLPPFDLKLTCLATGPHTIKARAEACSNTSPDYNDSKSKDYTVNTTPSVSLEFVPNATGNGKVIVSYSFPIRTTISIGCSMFTPTVGM
jgi:hypothetical protein